MLEMLVFFKMFFALAILNFPLKTFVSILRMLSHYCILFFRRKYSIKKKKTLFCKMDFFPHHTDPTKKKGEKTHQQIYNKLYMSIKNSYLAIP